MAQPNSDDLFLVNRGNTSYKVPYSDIVAENNAPGPIGPQGPRGIPGEPGATGEKGDIGPDGVPGTGMQMRGTTRSTTQAQIDAELPFGSDGSGAGCNVSLPSGPGNSFLMGCYMNGDTLMVKNGYKDGETDGKGNTGDSSVVDGSIWTWVVSDGDATTVGAGDWVLMGQFVSTPGPVGSTGATGIQGIQGIQGYQGIQGIQGDTGCTGSTGPKGDKPNHYWSAGADGKDTIISFELPDGSTGAAQDIQGATGPTGSIDNLEEGTGIEFVDGTLSSGSAGSLVTLKEATPTEIGGVKEPGTPSVGHLRITDGLGAGSWIAGLAGVLDPISQTGDNVGLNFNPMQGLEVSAGALQVKVGDGISVDVNGALTAAGGADNPDSGNDGGGNLIQVQMYNPQFIKWGNVEDDNNDGNDRYNVYTTSRTGSGETKESDWADFDMPLGADAAMIVMVWRTAIGPNNRQTYGPYSGARAGAVNFKLEYEVGGALTDHRNFNIESSRDRTRGELNSGNAYAHDASDRNGEFDLYKSERYDVRTDRWYFNTSSNSGHKQCKVRVKFRTGERKTCRVRGILGSRMMIFPYKRL